MNNETAPIPLNIPEALRALESLTAMLKTLDEQKGQREKSVSTVEPQTFTAKFGSASADTSRALQHLSETIDELIQHQRMNQKVLNLLNVIKADAARYRLSLAAVVIDIAAFVQESNPTDRGTTNINADEHK
jgi:hypothetical protein